MEHEDTFVQERQQETEADVTPEASDVFSCPRCKAPFTYLLRDRAEGNVPLVLQQCFHNMCLACVQASISEAEHPVINCRSLDHLIARLIDWLVDWLIGWLIDWLVDWLIDWFIDWLPIFQTYLYLWSFFRKNRWPRAWASSIDCQKKRGSSSAPFVSSPSQPECWGIAIASIAPTRMSRLFVPIRWMCLRLDGWRCGIMWDWRNFLCLWSWIVGSSPSNPLKRTLTMLFSAFKKVIFFNRPRTTWFSWKYMKTTLRRVFITSIGWTRCRVAPVRIIVCGPLIWHMSVWPIDWLIDWISDCSIDWLIDWTACSLIVLPLSALKLSSFSF